MSETKVLNLLKFEEFLKNESQRAFLRKRALSFYRIFEKARIQGAIDVMDELSFKCFLARHTVDHRIVFND